MISFVTDILTPGEHCLLEGIAHKEMTIRTLSGEHIATFPAPSSVGWTHAEVLRINEKVQSTPVILQKLRRNGADAYVGDQWIGSTEV